MEVAGRWRQQWSGAAEYGKVVDGVGGVTRMARALEVLHTSGPGARTRLTRSAFHAQGPLSSSYVFHSSKRTILSSRAEAEDLVSPHLVWRPQEMSSTPLDAASDSCPEGDEPYKVTEPDDNDISEPSKWRSSRVASEESSSVDTASLVDSNAIVSIPTKRADSTKTSSTSTSSIRDDEPKIRRPSFRRKPTSEPLMKIAEHARCLQSGKSQSNKTADEWHDRRNSYGFESSAYSGLKTLTEDDKMGMESSTDSGISKSTEVINIPIRHHTSQDHHLNGTENITEDSPGSFKDWLIKNRSFSASKADFSSIGRNFRDSNNGSINLKSLGKISISLPKYDSSDDDNKNKQDNLKNHCESSDKRQKKVGFCKTELHFAAESGIVNIIETDEKPPPKQDFRRRKSAFYPIRDKIERPITLFGATYSNESITTDAEQTYFGDDDNVQGLERLENDNDNDTTVKSILKNKIPKPKPYLLGEDIEFDKGRDSTENIWGVQLRRTSDEYASGNLIKSPISILNESLKQDNRLTSKYIQHDYTLNKIADINARSDLTSQEYKSSPVDYVNLSDLKKDLKSDKSVASTQTPEEFIYEKIKTNYRDQNMQTELEEKPNIESSTNFVHEKLKLLQLSPVLQNPAKTRNLRKNELSYFGVTVDSSKDKPETSTTKSIVEKHVKPQTRKSKSFEQPVYQNIPLLPAPAPMPAPRSKVESNHKDFEEIGSNDESVISDLSDIDERAPKSSNRTRVLEPINELRVSSKDFRKKISTEERDHNVETKRKSRSSISPVLTNIENPSRITKKKNSKESLNSRESSMEEIGPVPIMARRTSSNNKEKCKPSNTQRESIRRTVKSNSEKESHTERKQKPSSSTHLIPIDVSDYTRKSRIRSSSVDSRDASLKRNHTAERNNTNQENCQRSHSQTREKHSRHGSKEADATRRTKTRSSSADSRDKSIERNSSVERSYRNKENGHHIHLHSREKHPIIIEEPQNDKSSKRKTSHPTPTVDRIKEKPRKREYVINYDDKNGTCSSGHSKHDGTKRDKTKYGVTRKESKPKETSKSSRVTTLEVKNPLMSAKDSRQTRRNDHRSPRRKQKEESPQ